MARDLRDSRWHETHGISHIHKLVEECSKNTDGNEMLYNKRGNVCNSCTVYIVLFAIAFLMIIGISRAYFYFHWYLKNILFLLRLIPILKQQFIKHKNGSIKEIYIKNRTYYFFDYTIKIKDFDPDLLKIDKRSYNNIDVYYSGYITKKDFDYVKINSANPLYLIIDEVDGYIEEKNGNKFLLLVSTDKNKEVSIKYTELWDRIKNLIKEINDKPGNYGKDFMKIKFNSDDLPLNKK